MPLPRDVEAQLHALAYDDSGHSAELSIAVESLMAAVLSAVPSVTAVTVSNGDADPRLRVLAMTTVPQPAAASTALRLQLPGRGGAVVTFFADEPGVLDQLAADLPALLDVHRREAVLIANLHPPTTAANGAEIHAALADASVVDRALGVLLERGLPLDKGRNKLLELANADRTTRAAAARQVLAEASSAAGPDAV